MGSCAPAASETNCSRLGNANDAEIDNDDGLGDFSGLVFSAFMRFPASSDSPAEELHKLGKFFEDFLWCRPTSEGTVSSEISWIGPAGVCCVSSDAGLTFFRMLSKDLVFSCIVMSVTAQFSLVMDCLMRSNTSNYITQILDNTRFNFLLMEMHENLEIPAQFRPVCNT